MYGEYYDGKRKHRPIERRPPEPGDMPDGETARLIREAVGRYPKATAEEVRVFVKELERGPEFDVKAIRAVMHFG